jgi:hypothetical protein
VVTLFLGEDWSGEPSGGKVNSSSRFGRCTAVAAVTVHYGQDAVVIATTGKWEKTPHEVR